MSNEELRLQTQRTVLQTKIAGEICVASMMIIAACSVIWTILAALTWHYYSNSKTLLDAAEAGSGLLSQLGLLKRMQLWLLPL